MRTLMRDLWGDSGAEDDGTPESWRMIWVPPAMPRRRLSGPYRGAGRFSKRLVFSQWAVAPKSISILVSNRSQSLARDAARSVRGDSWQPLRYPLRPGVRKESGSLSKVWTWGMAYPSWVLAELGDVTGYTRRTGQSLPVDPDEQRRDVAERLRPRLAELAERFGEGRGAVDARWYGVAGVLLDRLAATVSGAPWVGPARLGLVGSLPGNSEGIHAHLEALDDPGTLGAQPDDLADRLAQLALAAPGVCALRALAGVESGDSSEQWSDALRWKPVRSGALRIGWAMLRLFDRAEIQAAIWAGFQVDHGRRLAEEDPESRSQAYLRAALDQCLAGDLDAVFSEYLHQIGEAAGMFESGRGTDAMTRVVDEVVSALTIKTANQQLRPLTVQDGRVMEAEPEKMPCRFALRYGDAVPPIRRRTGRRWCALLSIRRSGRSPWRPPPPARRGSTSIGTAAVSSTGICPVIPSIWSSARGGSIATSAWQCGRTSRPRGAPTSGSGNRTTPGRPCSGSPRRRSHHPVRAMRCDRCGCGRRIPATASVLSDVSCRYPSAGSRASTAVW